MVSDSKQDIQSRLETVAAGSARLYAQSFIGRAWLADYVADVDSVCDELRAEIERRAGRDALTRQPITAEWVTLDDLPKGALFETRSGSRAVKSEYRYPTGQWECTLLASGEYAHFGDGNATEVREIDLEAGCAENERLRERKCFVCTDWMKQAERANAEAQRMRDFLKYLKGEAQDRDDVKLMDEIDRALARS